MTPPPYHAEGVSPGSEVVYDEYNASLEYFPETNSVSGVVRVTYKNRALTAQSSVSFNLYQNAFLKNAAIKPYFPSAIASVMRNGEDYGGINIIKVWVNGAAVLYHVRDTVLTVLCPYTIQPGGVAVIDIQFDAHIPKIAHRTGYNDNAVWFGNFLPILSVYEAPKWRTDPYYPAGKPFYSNVANYTVRITAPEDYIVVGTGEQSFTGADGKRTTVFTANMTRDFAFAISSAYIESGMRSESGVYVNFSHFTETDNTEAILKTAADCLDFFAEKIGGYPYSSLNISETGSYLYGATYPRMIFLSTECIQTDNANVRAVTVANGVARQWFYNIVGNDQINAAWLSEGLAAFLAYEFTYRGEALQEAMDDLYKGLADEYDSLAYTALTESLSVYETAGEYNAIQANKAALMFFALRERLRAAAGTGAFNEFLRLYLKDNYFQIATPESIIAAAEEIYGESLAEFFDAWLGSGPLPVMGRGQ